MNFYEMLSGNIYRMNGFLADIGFSRFKIV